MKSAKASKNFSKNRRSSSRKEVMPLKVSYISDLSNFTKIAKNCEIIQASSTGLLLTVKRDAFIPLSLRRNLNVDILLGTSILIKIEIMNLEISGVISRTQLGGNKNFLIAIDYREDAPEYWRECLNDLLPEVGELDEH